MLQAVLLLFSLSIFYFIFLIPLCGKKKKTNKKDSMPTLKREIEMRKEVTKAQEAAAKEQKDTEESKGNDEKKEENKDSQAQNQQGTAATSEIKDKGTAVVSNPIVSLVSEAGTGEIKK